MKNPIRVTIALDKETNKLFEKLRNETNLSQSELFRQALRFYSESKDLFGKIGEDKIGIYAEMLGGGEHIILDIDHWHLFLNSIVGSREEEKFWAAHKEVAESHAEQLAGKIGSVEDLLKRLEACNFYKLTTTDDGFTIVLASEKSKRFVKEFIEEVSTDLGFKVEVREDLSKLRIKVLRK
jgi:hypothetical protein